MIALALLLIQATAAEPQTVVVTATYARLAADLRRCERQGCGTLEDITASVRLAEAAFRKGDYRTARDALRRSVGRNRAAAPQFPEAVSNLYYAQAKVAQHYGDKDEFLDASLKSYQVLRNHRPDSDDRFRAEMEVGDLLVARGRINEARQLYAAAATRAAAGTPLLADAFRVRLAWADDRAGERGKAKRALDALLAAPSSPALATAAALLRARIAREEGDEARSAALLARITASPTPAPLLLSQADIPGALVDARPLKPDPLTTVGPSTDLRPGDFTNLQWVDIGYWIRPDGSVGEPEVLRGNGSTAWSRPLLGWVASRRYAPTKGTTGDPGSFHIERFTQTAEFVTPVGSNIRRRAGRSSVVSTELGR